MPFLHGVSSEPRSPRRSRGRVVPRAGRRRRRAGRQRRTMRPRGLDRKARRVPKLLTETVLPATDGHHRRSRRRLQAALRVPGRSPAAFLGLADREAAAEPGEDSPSSRASRLASAAACRRRSRSARPSSRAPARAASTGRSSSTSTSRSTASARATGSRARRRRSPPAARRPLPAPRRSCRSGRLGRCAGRRGCGRTPRGTTGPRGRRGRAAELAPRLLTWRTCGSRSGPPAPPDRVREAEHGVARDRRAFPRRR